MKGLCISDNPDFFTSLNINKSLDHIDFMILIDIDGVNEKVSSKLSNNEININFLNSSKLVNSNVDELGGLLESVEDCFVNETRLNKIFEKCFNYGNQKNGYIFTHLSEQNSYKSDYIFKLSQLKTILDLIGNHDYDLIYLAIQDCVLYDSILRASTNRRNIKTISYPSFINKFLYYFRHWFWIFKAIVYFLRIILRSSYSKLFRYVTQALNNTNSDITFVSYFPLIKSAHLQSRGFHNLYFHPLQKYLKKTHQKIRWIFIYINNNNFNFFSANRLAENIVEDEYSFIDENLTILDSFRVLFDYIKTVFIFSLKRREIKSIVNKDNALSNIGTILPMYFFEQAIYGISLLSSISYYYMFRSVSHTFDKSHSVVYLNEMQNWEKAMNIAFQENGLNLTTIGFAHSSVSNRLFSYTKNRVKSTNLDPMPTYFAVNGSFAFNLLSDVVGDGLVLVEAIRYFQHFNMDRVLLKNKRRKVLIIGSYDKKETNHIINTLKAFKVADNIDLLFKQHPSGKVTNKSTIKINNNLSIKVSNDTITNLLIDTKVVIVGSSTSSIDALAHNCSIIIPIFPDVLCVNPLLNESSFAHKVYSSSELYTKTLELLDSKLSDKEIELSEKFLSHFWLINNELPNWKSLI